MVRGGFPSQALLGVDYICLPLTESASCDIRCLAQLWCVCEHAKDVSFFFRWCCLKEKRFSILKLHPDLKQARTCTEWFLRKENKLCAVFADYWSVLSDTFFTHFVPTNEFKRQHNSGRSEIPILWMSHYNPSQPPNKPPSLSVSLCMVRVTHSFPVGGFVSNYAQRHPLTN